METNNNFTHHTGQYGNYLLKEQAAQNQAYFNKVVRCSQHDKQCTMICMMENCKDRIMCQDCIQSHTHSHLHKLIPLHEFNSQTNAIPNFISEKTASQIYTIQKHLDTLKPFISETPSEVQSHKIQNFLTYQEQMMKEVIPALEIQTNNLSAELLTADVFINKKEFEKALTDPFYANLTQNKLFTFDKVNEEDYQQNFDNKKKIRENRSHRYFSSMVDILDEQKLSHSIPSFNNPYKKESPSLPVGNEIPYGHFHDSKPVDIQFSGHKDIVTFICPIDYNRFASASGDYTIKLWRFDQVYAQETLEGHQGDIWGLVMVSDRYLASCSADKCIKIWDINNLSCVATLTQGHSDSIKCLVFIKSQKILCSGGSDAKIQIWNLQEKKIMRTLGRHEGLIKNMDYNEKYKILASCSSDKSCKIWNMEKFQCMFTLTGHKSDVNAVCFLNDAVKYDEFQVASGDYNGYILIWNVQKGHLLKQFKAHNGAINGLQCSFRQNLLLSCSNDKTIKGHSIKSYLLAYSKKVSSSLSHMVYYDARNIIVSAGWDHKIRAITLEILNQNNAENNIMRNESLNFVHNWAKHDYKYITSLDQ